MNMVADFPALANSQQLRQIDVEYDADTRTMYWWMKPAPRPCFNSAFLEEVERFESGVEQHGGWFRHEGVECKIENAVFGSRIPGVFNLGGDLSMFIKAILAKDRKSLTHYGDLCINNMLRRITGFGAGVMTYTLLQGKAFGGGFECALSLLARRIGMRKAEEIIMSGQVFTAKQMYDIGVVDEVVEDGQGLAATQALIKARQKRRNSYRAMSLAKREFQPVNHAEMKAIVDVWVDAALRLENRDLRMMGRLVRAQDKLANGCEEEDVVDQLFAREPMVVNG
jgi:DSF synthase